jgi:hypothetical protein
MFNEPKTVVFNDLELFIRTNMRVGIGGDRWPAATLFSELLTQNRLQKFFENLFDNKVVIELGSGTGLDL